MNAIQNFAFEEHLVRVIDQEGEPWFVGKDVCGALALANHNQALARLDGDEKGVTSVDPLGRGGVQEMVIVSEPGAYRLAFSSRKPEAERFKRWLAHEVLPQIRRTGAYQQEERPELVEIDITKDAPLAARVDAVRLARVLFGTERARVLWSKMGLPSVPEASEWQGQGEAKRLYTVLLNHKLTRGEVRQLILDTYEGDETARLELLTFGIKVAEDDEGFWLGQSTKDVKAIYREIGHYDHSWLLALRRIPGARPGARQSFLGQQSRTTWFPISSLDS